MLARFILRLVFASMSTLLMQPQLSLAAAKIQTKPGPQKIVLKPFSAEDAFGVHSANLRTLMLELYECQPQALQKSTKVSKEEFVQWVFEGPFGWKFDSIKNVQSIEALTLGLRQEYQGDRILPLITGLYTMILLAYGGKNEFTFTEIIKPNNIIIAAHNVEISATKLHNIQNESGELYLNERCIANTQQKLHVIKNKFFEDYKAITKQEFDSSLSPIQTHSNVIELIQF